VALKKEQCTKQWNVYVLLVLLNVLSESPQIMRPVAMVNMCLNYLVLIVPEIIVTWQPCCIMNYHVHYCSHHLDSLQAFV
jgi:hypothetical protein